jgi:formyltetrahydrofolate deformylase
MRMVFDSAAEAERGALYERFDAEVGTPLRLDYRFAQAGTRKRLAIMVSREDHCLSDLLWRWRNHELEADVVSVISNHPDHTDQVSSLGIPFHVVPADPTTKREAERRMLELVHGVELLVLARYMQILSGDFLERLGAPVLNIHHSFLPAFAGAGPYEQAKRRGVKLIGATAHYVTEELDAGPIIEQDVIRVSHREDVDTLGRLGSDIERTVLMRAVQSHCEDRVLVHGGTTVVF